MAAVSQLHVKMLKHQKNVKDMQYFLAQTDTAVDTLSAEFKQKSRINKIYSIISGYAYKKIYIDNYCYYFKADIYAMYYIMSNRHSS